MKSRMPHEVKQKFVHTLTAFMVPQTLLLTKSESRMQHKVIKKFFRTFKSRQGSAESSLYSIAGQCRTNP